MAHLWRFERLRDNLVEIQVANTVRYSSYGCQNSGPSTAHRAGLIHARGLKVKTSAALWRV